MPKTTTNEWDEVTKDGVSAQDSGVNFNQEGDWFVGTKTGRKDNVQGTYGETFIWLFIGKAGVYHKKDGTEVVVTPGAAYYIWSKKTYDDVIKEVAIGQEFGIKYTGKQMKKDKTGEYNTYETKLLGMNDEWLARNPQSVSAKSEADMPDIMTMDDSDVPFK